MKAERITAFGFSLGAFEESACLERRSSFRQLLAGRQVELMPEELADDGVQDPYRSRHVAAGKLCRATAVQSEDIRTLAGMQTDIDLQVTRKPPRPGGFGPE